MLIFNRPHISQPSTVARVNNYNSLTRGLIFLATGNQPRNIVTGEFGDAAAVIPTQLGIGLNSVSKRFPRPSVKNSIENTILVVANPIAEAARRDIITVSNPSAPFQQFTLAANTTTTGAGESGSLSAWLYSGAFYSGTKIAGAKIDGGFHVYCVVLDSSYFLDIYQDGRQPASYATRTAGVVSWSLAVTGIQYGATNSSAVLAAMWDRMLSAEEVREVSANPWCLFSSKSRQNIWVPSVVSSVPTLSASTYVPGSLTSTGWRPQITAS